MAGPEAMTYHQPYCRSRDMPDNDQATKLANAVKLWWEEHKYDVTGDRGEWNLYDHAPAFVDIAKTIIGDWEAKAAEESDDNAND
jgi:hypothetical protein